MGKKHLFKMLLSVIILVFGFSVFAQTVTQQEELNKKNQVIETESKTETENNEESRWPENFAFLVNGKIFYLNYIIQDNIPYFTIESVFNPLKQAGLDYQKISNDEYKIVIDENEFSLDLKHFLIKSTKLYVDEKEKEKPDFKPPEPIIIPVDILIKDGQVYFRYDFLVKGLPELINKVVGYDKNSGTFVVGREKPVKINFELKETEPYAILTFKCPAKIKYNLIKTDKNAYLTVNARFNIEKEKLIELESKFFKIVDVKFFGRETEINFELKEKTDKISGYFDRNFDELKIYFYSKDFYNPKVDTLNKAAVELDATKHTIKKIIIDPGHGGEDNGAVSKDGTMEKDIALQIAYKLGKELKKRGYEVVLTRYTDVYVPLKDRTGIANSNKGDLFISIHLNASYRKASGAETYILSLDGYKQVSDTIAFENREIKNSKSKDNKGKDEQSSVSFILWDMAQREYIKDSEKLGEFIQEGLNNLMGIRDRGVKQAPLVVLKGLDMPGVLVEVGFLSNPVEETKLKSEDYQNRVVNVIANSVDRYRIYYELRMKKLSDNEDEE
ncbi:N-acetylmuramoyl-L-alanine amidase family protein [Thermotomaculum hydrothermale]|nr:N-acetylmuramoyl-L-alanine amidase [Thermotomaculum hydrothermale]